jgi:hypothetical protein
MEKATIVRIVSAGIGGLLVGGGSGFILANKLQQKKYQAIVDQQIAEVKDFYSKKYKEGDYSTPEAAMQTLHPDSDFTLAPELPDSVKEALQDYNGTVSDIQEALPGFNAGDTLLLEESEFLTPLPSAEEIKEGIERTRKNIWDEVAKEAQPMAEIDTDGGGPVRDPENPYVITIEAFHDQNNYAKITIMYYEGDNTLCDDAQSVIPDINGTVGPNALSNFGAFSEDENIVYVRNEKLEVDWEVVRSSQAYAHAVAGFDVDNEQAAKSPIRKMRDVE